MKRTWIELKITIQESNTKVEDEMQRNYTKKIEYKEITTTLLGCWLLAFF